MQAEPVIRAALEQAGLPTQIDSMRNLAGGCIHEVMLVTLRDGSRVVAKINRADSIALFEEETHGLRALARTQTVFVPQPLVAIAHERHAVLLMTALDAASSADDDAWKAFGAELAALHQCDVGARYGFEIDNHIGSTLQPNGWRDDWVEFNTVNRLGFQLKMVRQKQLMDASECGAIETVIDRLEQFIPRQPKPALLHGDLWSGNAVPTRTRGNATRIAVIDPACSIGDGWADIAMMRLFGGFPANCFQTYAAAMRECKDLESRISVYQLYHLLNHVNIFGSGYAPQALALARRLLC